MKYIFIGGTYRGFKVLETLLILGKKPDYCFILKEDDHEESIYSTKLAELAELNGIQYSIKKRIDKTDHVIFRKTFRDFALVCGWRTIIDYKLSESFKLGFLAAHDSLLPKYRGFSPINWSVINGEKTTGVTLFKINGNDVDSGDIIGQVTVEISQNDYAIDVYKKITIETVNLITKFFEGFAHGNYNFTKQNNSNATYGCKRIPEDGRICWDKSAKEVYNLIRGLAYPYPGAYVFFNNALYRIRKAELGELNSNFYVGNIPGRIIKISDKGVEVLCKRGSILLTQWESKEKNIIENPSKRIKLYSTTL